MAKGRGVVLEISDQQAVVLDETGLFRHVPATGQAWQVGDEIWVDLEADAAPLVASRRAGRPWWQARGWAVAAACAVLVAVGVPLGYQAEVNAQTVAIVTFDVNPSVQLDLNRTAHVLRAVALDQDGGTLLQHVHISGAPLTTALADLTSQAAAEGFVPKTETVPIVIAAAPAHTAILPAAVTTAIQGEEQRTAATMTKAGFHVAVAAVSAAPSDQKSATQMKLSLGRYLIYQQAKKIGVIVNPADLRKGPIVAALRQAGATDAVVQQLLRDIAERDLHGNGRPADAGSGGRSGAAGSGAGAGAGGRGAPGRGGAATGSAQRTSTDGRGQGHGKGQDKPSGSGEQGRTGMPGMSVGAGQQTGGRGAAGAGSGVAGTSGGGDNGGDSTGRGGRTVSQGGAVRQGVQQSSVWWPQQIWQELQGFFRVQGSDRGRSGRGDVRTGGAIGPGSGAPTATATATASSSARKRGDHGRSGQGH